jgi:competence protein ComEC
VGFVWLTGARFIIGIAYFTLLLYEKLATLAVKIPFSIVITGAPSFVQMLLYFGLMIFIVWYYSFPKEMREDKKIYRNIAILLFMAGWMSTLFSPKNLEVDFLDVGQGDAIAIHTPKGKHILMDGGGQYQGKTILSYLRYKGVKELDAVLLTHPDADHITGLIELLDWIDVKKIFVSDGAFEEDELYQIFIHKAWKRTIPVYCLIEGDELAFETVHMQCIYPGEKKVDTDGWNHYSMVIYMMYKNQSFLLTGDIEKEEEKYIIQHYQPIKGTVLKVAHHGSRTSSTEAFVEWSKPAVGVISCGLNNSYGHPHKEVVQRYKKFGIPLYITANQGAVLMKTDGDVLTVQKMLKKRRGF